MEYVLVVNSPYNVVLIWIKGGESGRIQEFGSKLYAIRWCQEARVAYRFATKEEME